MDNYLEQAIGAMLMSEAIIFEAYSWSFGYVDMVVKNSVFTEPEFIISVLESNWNDGPAASVTKELARLIMCNKINFLPVQEKTA